jgi:hypothetical protein
MSIPGPPAAIPGLVSVIVPVFNRKKMLLEAVTSAENQSYQPVEIILVDDGSTDGTGELCEELAARRPSAIRVVHQANAGPGAAREAGRVVARGEYLQYLDSDDLLYSRKLERQVAALAAAPEAGIAYCWTRLRLGDGTFAENPWKGSGESRERMFPWFLTERWWDTPNPLYRRTICDAAGAWLPLWQEEDWEYDCRIAATGVAIVHVAEFLVEVREHSEGRLSGGTGYDRKKLVGRCQAHRRVFAHARRAGIGPDSPFMQQYARELFLLARQAGDAGLCADARGMFLLARDASGEHRSKCWDFVAYATLVSVLGWKWAGRLSCRLDRLRPKGNQ